MRKKDGIYANYCNSDKARLICRRASVAGRMFLAVTNGERVIAMKSWEELNREMFEPGPYLILDEDGNLLDGEI